MDSAIQFCLMKNYQTRLFSFLCVCVCVTGCLSVPAPTHKGKDVVRVGKTKTYMPPPQPAYLENNPKLLLILNSFVSRTTHRRPSLLHVRLHATHLCETEAGGCGFFFQFPLLPFWPWSDFICTSLPPHPQPAPLSLSKGKSFIHMLQMTEGEWRLQKSEINVALCYDRACYAPAGMIHCNLYK